MNCLAAALSFVCGWLSSQFHKAGPTLSCSLFALVPSFAQDISIQQIEMEGRTIAFSYSLNDTTRGRTYIVGLYSSRDNFTYALQHTTGDVGVGITPGNKKIVWNAGEEFGSTFEGTIAFEVRSKVYVPFVRLQDFDKVQKRVRGVPFDLTWTGGRPQNILRIDLLKKDDHRVASFSNIANSGHYSMTIPLSVKQGEGYRLKIYDPKNPDDVVYTQSFNVAPRIPLLYKVAPAVLMVVAGCLVWSNSSGSDTNDIPPFPAAPR